MTISGFPMEEALGTLREKILEEPDVFVVLGWLERSGRGGVGRCFDSL